MQLTHTLISFSFFFVLFLYFLNSVPVNTIQWPYFKAYLFGRVHFKFLWPNSNKHCIPS